ncbi:MAG TPA: S1/P1 Nuclease [Thermoanaerobaculia bacterium]|nr:S1/P1 Nuclease [Thermoanaerobaculia bacterium]
MRPQFDPYSRNYASLSVKDLLDARDAYHVHLTHMRNVFATAIGRYRLRPTDPDTNDYRKTRAAGEKRGSYGARTLENSVVRPWSWPCVLVFVSDWIPPEELQRQRESLVPPFLYLPDGRVVPTCVLLASLYEGTGPTLGPLMFSSHLVGGGYPVLTDVQGKEHAGSVACLVTDGERTYALTNQHVTGAAGQEVFTVVKGERSRIGVSAPNSLRKLPFGRVYPGLAGSQTMSNLDIGLIDVDDVAQWTSQVFGLGVLGAPIDFDTSTANLDWIGCKVVAHGAASGRLEGEIKALFYRYRSIAGTDYVTDFLIGGRGDQPLPTAPGDSGTLWCIDPEMLPEPVSAGNGKNGKQPAEAASPKYRPFALQWGGQKLSGDDLSAYTQFSLASSVSVACRELDVEIVADLNAEHAQYWGAVGHYKIAELAIAELSPALRTFFKDNLTQLTYDEKQLATGDVSPDPKHFVPLADVPDVVWKSNINKTGKGVRSQENWNHYADMDLPGSDGRLLFDLCGDPAARLDIAAWLQFYRDAPKPKGDTSSKKTVNMGALPFRVWQIFDAMVGYRKAGDKVRFLAAAGVLAHYIGDACQPLHSSMHADGLDGASTGVHGMYEERMIDSFPAELESALDALDAKSLTKKITRKVDSGFTAGLAAINLMRRVHDYLPPVHICEVFDKLGGGRSKGVVSGLWKAVGTDTARCIADGTRTLALLWDAAYATVKGKPFKGAVDRAALQKIYTEEEGFIPSLHLANLDPADYVPPAKTKAKKA